MTVIDLASATVITPTAQQVQAAVDFRNHCATARPDLYGDATYTVAQARADAQSQDVLFYQSSGTLRGYLICNICEYGDPDQGRSLALRIGDLVIDPALLNGTTLRTAMNLLKAAAQKFHVSLTLSPRAWG